MPDAHTLTSDAHDTIRHTLAYTYTHLPRVPTCLFAPLHSPLLDKPCRKAHMLPAESRPGWQLIGMECKKLRDAVTFNAPIVCAKARMHQ